MIILYIDRYEYDRYDDKGHSVAYSMLAEIFAKKFNTPCPIIKKTEQGKPYFEASDIHFSISHGKGLAAVLLSNEGECGVDIEPQIESVTAEMIESRFLSESLPITPLLRDVEVVFGRKMAKEMSSCEAEKAPHRDTDKLGAMGENDPKIGLQTLAVTSYEELPTTAKWTHLEAMLKLSGYGFSDFSKRKNHAAVAGTKTLFSGGGQNPFYVTVAVKNK